MDARKSLIQLLAHVERLLGHRYSTAPMIVSVMMTTTTTTANVIAATPLARLARLELRSNHGHAPRSYEQCDGRDRATSGGTKCRYS